MTGPHLFEGRGDIQQCAIHNSASGNDDVRKQRIHFLNNERIFGMELSAVDACYRTCRPEMVRLPLGRFPWLGPSS
jgi:hypothetical protein